MIPLRLLVEKVEEMKVAERMAMETRMLHQDAWEKEQEECDDLHQYFRSRHVAGSDKIRLVQRLVEWYKEKPLAERARLSWDPSNEAASKLAGISSRTMVKARSDTFEPAERHS